jgi:hypothetical protein
MAGSLEVGVEVIDELSVAIGTLVQQAPKTADNRKFRFPFWDTTNGADNRQNLLPGYHRHLLIGAAGAVTARARSGR